MKYLGLTLLFIGVALIGISKFTTYKVIEETSTYHNASNKLSDNKLVDMSGAETKKVTKGISSGINKKIDKEAKPYEKLASIEMTLGFALAILGLAITIFFKKR